jgi:hypothetical protein
MPVRPRLGFEVLYTALTLGDAVAAVSAVTADEREVVAVVRHMLQGESIRLGGAQRTIGSNWPRPVQPLFGEFAEAARQKDRAAFDRLFDRCFDRVYAVAWRVTRDRVQSEAITTHVLREVVIETL